MPFIEASNIERPSTTRTWAYLGFKKIQHDGMLECVALFVIDTHECLKTEESYFHLTE